MVKLDPIQAQFYSTVASLSDGLPPWEERKFVTVLRMIAGHPSSLLYSDGEIAKSIVDQVSADGIRAIPSSKTLKMVEWCETVVRDQGAQAVIFTFYAHAHPTSASGGPRSLWVLRKREPRPGLSTAQRSAAQREFRAGETQIFLTSDAGQKRDKPSRGYIPIAF